MILFVQFDFIGVFAKKFYKRLNLGFFGFFGLFVYVQFVFWGVFSKNWFIIGICINLILLFVFKYSCFLFDNINQLLTWLKFENLPVLKLILPIGISFYTFHSISYLTDVYLKKSIAQKNIINLSLYIVMFFQLVAGPIVRYEHISNQLTERLHSIKGFSEGVERFLIGLFKKILVSNMFAIVSDEIFSSNLKELNSVNAIFGLLCYSLQIYTDFSAYSDMAIGLAKMFGFEIKENFNFPYKATSIQDFWRRWHISLSTFFRDYVYIPLGGNKVKQSRIYFNLIIVFFLTGFWHGASWNFIIWGLFHGFFIILERLFLLKYLEKTINLIRIFYTLFIVFFAWVLFKLEDLHDVIEFWKAMFNFTITNEQSLFFDFHFNSEIIFVFIISIIGVFDGYSKLYNTTTSKLILFGMNQKNILNFFNVLKLLFFISLLIVCSSYLAVGSYNPFIYFRF